MSNDQRVAWVLGAGFSMPLGGPSLRTLLSPGSAVDLSVRYPDAPLLNDATAVLVRSLYHYGSSYSNGLPEGALTTGEDVWQDPEDFLDFIDTAADSPDGPHAKRLSRLIGKLSSSRLEAKDIRHSARRLMGAECCGFLENADIASEKWQPFVSWANQLREHDTVITFNYDRVIERIGARYVMVVPPGSEKYDMARDAKCCPVLKLHGSVDWEKTGNGTVRECGPTHVLNCADDLIAIATPGPTKKRKAAEYDDLWRYARDALTAAEAIVFIGYRFPPTDAEARSRILDAISANKTDRLALHVVLGLDRPADTARMESLLAFASERAGRAPASGSRRRGTAVYDGNGLVYKLFNHPLYGQDFLSVWSRPMLFT